ncbi:hypothetical protein F0L46_17335 [Salinarimonas soli]|uniref:GcrA cell cycle regulator n=1 Tax=Salinarimonas soli TaxID=1638099 RepID=A0A5B2VCR3_9HYPH|nr:hypothetical protein F0L46_17335 [Salinarimonas soli]
MSTTSTAVSILAAAHDQCRFIVSDKPGALCCGARTVLGSSWCIPHHRLVYTTPQARRAR